MLTHDPVALLEASLRKERAPSGNLYPSSDLLAPLRHSMLRAAGAPKRADENVLGLVRMETGTMWHERFEGLMRRSNAPVMLEVRLTPWLVEGWSGIADWIAWSDEYRAFVLGDLKTIKAEGMAWVKKGGIKQEHLWQLSAYWYALEKMGLPLVKAFNVLYLPMSPLDDIEPALMEGVPLDRDLVLGTMVDRAAATRKYLNAVLELKTAAYHHDDAPYDEQDPRHYLNEHLAPIPEREQVVRWNKEQGVFDVKLQPHYSAMFCLYPHELCDCSTKGTTKIGQWEWAEYGGGMAAVYTPRKGYEEYGAPDVELSSAQIKKLREEYEKRHGSNVAA